MELEFGFFAARKGLALAGIFPEFVCGVHDAFEELLEEVQRTDAHYVIIPTLRHLARNGFLQDVLLDRLRFAGAEVFCLVEDS
ncbi:hypothetical protein [Amycolatopsis sp. NPDC059657]|uniref:hypothetical protein n=1 Tax=Amycolatopsis sp. NPDC059657 TaxID=3346899 RepID=UPI00367234C2